MFLEIDKKDKNKIALLDSEGSACSYGDVKDFASLFYSLSALRQGAWTGERTENG